MATPPPLEPRNAFALDPRQREIHKLLQLIGPEPADYFADCCRIMAGAAAVRAQTHLAAHLLREIEGRIHEVLEPMLSREARQRITEAEREKQSHLVRSPVSGCGRLTTGGRCAEHRRQRRAERQRRPIERIYDSPRWRSGTRPAVLARDGYRCVLCGATQAETRLDVAHRIPTQELLACGLDPFDPELCETCCARCHGSKPGQPPERCPEEDGAAGASEPSRTRAPAWPVSVTAMGSPWLT